MTFNDLLDNEETYPASGTPYGPTRLKTRWVYRPDLGYAVPVAPAANPIMAYDWQSDPVIQPASTSGYDWTQDPVVQNAQQWPGTQVSGDSGGEWPGQLVGGSSPNPTATVGPLEDVSGGPANALQTPNSASFMPSSIMTPEEMSRTGQTQYEPSTVTAGTTQDPINNQPLVPPYLIRPALEAGMALNPATQIPYLMTRAFAPQQTEGVTQGGADALAGFTTVNNLPWLAAGAVMPEGAAGKVGQTALAAYFEAQAIHHTPELWQAYQASTDPSEKVHQERHTEITRTSAAVEIPRRILTRRKSRSKRRISADSPLREAGKHDKGTFYARD